jgi:uncharacterized protein YbaP (TraB family)
VLPSSKRGKVTHHEGGPLFYQITKPGSPDTSYLFGTFHLLGQSYVDTIQTLMRALRRADVIVGEFSMADFKPSDLMAGMQSPIPLDSLLRPRDYKLVAKALVEATGDSISEFNEFKPLVLYSAIVASEGSDDTSAVQELPMDLYFQQVARDSGLRVMGLELPSDQVTMLYDSIPLSEQAAMLLDLVKHHKKTGKDIQTMQRDYMSGKVEELMDDPEMDGLSAHDKDLFLYHRNERWLGELPQILDNHNTFIAVGAGHLVGARGLVKGLKKMGYEVKGIMLN